MRDVEASLVSWPDGSTRHLRQWPCPGARDVALLLHGSESHGGWFQATATALNACGLAALAPDRPGWGMSPGPRGKLRSAALALSDVGFAAERARTIGDRIHLVGISWGGLLAAAAREALPATFASVTLIAPALFPLRQPPLWQIIRRALLGRSIPLDLRPEDFSADPGQRQFISDDSVRILAVDVHFLMTTGWLLRRVRRDFHRQPAPPTQILLAEHDRIVDSQAALRLAASRGVSCHTLPGTVHSLILERPAEVADKIAVLARNVASGARHAP